MSLAGATLLGVAVGSPPAAAAASPASTASPITYTTSVEPLTDLGTVNFRAIAGSSTGAPAARAGQPQRAVHVGRLPLAAGQKKPVSAGSFGVQKANVAGEVGFEGVSGPQQAQASGFDLEPPDQATCTGPDAGGQPVTFDFVNDAAAAYSTTGQVELPTMGAEAMFNQPSSAFLSDPRCYYDASTERWFFTMFSVGSPAPSTQFVAVSKTADPFGDYEVFGIDTTDAANPFGDCPCFGDFDMIGADANGFYITTNEFSNVNAAPGFNGTVLYALSKQGLEAAASGTAPPPTVARYAITGDAFGASTPTQGDGPYHVSPASTPPGGTYAPGSEYFVESNSELAADNHLLVYALQGTSQLASGGIPTLSAAELTSEPYSFPPNAAQRPGPLPLGNSLGYSTPSTLQADFNAVQQMTYTAGHLYGELDTAVGNSASAPGVDGVDWFSLAPSSSGSGVSASVVKQGYVASSQNLLYPDLVLDGAGHGYLDFSVSGPADYPSPGYVAFHSQATGPVHLATTGAGPEDGFSCYPPAAGCRWGDYSAGAVWGGRAYMMTEYIPPSPRDHYTNWGTFVWSAPVY